MSVECSFFFFQAEDGIRDVAVTGVQTCALPISRHQRFGGFGPNAARSIARTVHARRARKPATRPTGGAWLESGVFGTGTPAARCASGSSNHPRGLGGRAPRPAPSPRRAHAPAPAPRGAAGG